MAAVEGDPPPARVRRLGRRVVRPARGLARALAASCRVLPDYLIVGAQKAGTSSLHAYLGKHSRVLTPRSKEIHYFDNNHDASPLWYRRHFPSQWRVARRALVRGRPVATGEATPFYLFHPHGASRIDRLLPHVKIIVLLREPVARAYSHYRHERRHGREPLSFEEAVAAEPARLHEEHRAMGEIAAYDDPTSLHRRASYLARGRYAEQVRRYLDVFGESQVLIVFSERLFAAPQRTYAQVLDFLGLPQEPLRDATVHNAGGAVPRVIPAADELKRHFAPHNEELASLLGTRPPW